MAIELPPEGQNPHTEPAPRSAVPEGAGVVEGVIVSGAPAAAAGSMAPERLPGERRDILPPWMRSRAELRAAIAIVGGQQWHRARYHGLRSPGSSDFCAWPAVQLAWAWMTEAMSLQSAAAAAGDDRAWRNLHRDVQETRRVRLTVLAFEALMIAAGCVALVRLAPWWAQGAAAVVCLPLLAWIGRPEGKPIISAGDRPAAVRAADPDADQRGAGHAGDQRDQQGAARGRPGDPVRVRCDARRARAGRRTWTCPGVSPSR